MTSFAMASEQGDVRIAIAGLGLVGKRHAQALAQTAGASLCAVLDPSETASTDAQALGVPHFLELAQLVQDVRPDGIVLSTPTRVHVEHALACVRAGIPVLVEKPLSDDLAQAASLVQAALEADVAVMVGHHRRFNPLIAQAKAAIEAGRIGDIRAVQATCWFYKPDDYFDIAPWRKRAGAGPISVNLVHDVDLLRYFCGEVVRVQAQATPSRRGYDNEDVAAALLTFESGAIGTISVSDSIVSPWSWELTAKEYPVYPATNQSAYQIGGSTGALSIPDLNVWTHKDAPDWWSPISATVSPTEQADPLVRQMEHFIEVIQGQATPLVSGHEGLRTLRVIDAIQRAADSGDAVTLSVNQAEGLST